MVAQQASHIDYNLDINNQNYLKKTPKWVLKKQRMKRCQDCLNKIIVLISFCIGSIYSLSAQDFMMQGWFWDYPKTANGALWADTLENKAADLGAAGFTYVWLPPLSRASFGDNSNGYDPQDLYDLGIPEGGGATGFGTRANVDDVIAAFDANGIQAVADVVYNHRDGGAPEENPSVEGWIENFNCTKVNSGDNAFPSDRFRCYLPLGGSTGNGAGTYYFKIRSASKHPNYYGKEYTLYMETNTTGFQGLSADSEDESSGGNGGGDCGQGNNTIQLGVDMIAAIDNVGNCSGGCGIDEFALSVGSSDFNAAGDTLWIYMTNPNGNYSDHFITGLWDGSADIQSQIRYQTYTDFTNMPSGRGGMDYTFFKPNGNPTQLEGDWDWMWFFYDYDQRYNQAVKDTLNEWSKWLWEDVGIRGYRMDAVKHFNHEFTGDLMDYLHDQSIDPGMVVGEFFDGNAGVLSNWVATVESFMDADTRSSIQVRAFDFAMRDALKAACDNFGYDVRNVFNSGMVDGSSSSSSNVVTFVNNHDFREEGQPVQNDPMLAYAYILTNNQIGLPSVFYPDYFESDIPHAPSLFLKAEIDELMQIHQDYIYQSSSADYLNRIGTPYAHNYIEGFENTTLLYQLSGGIGGQEVIVAINFAGETLKVDHEINMTNVNIGDQFTDILGRSNFPVAIVNGSNQLYFELPPRSYSVWVNNVAPLAADLIEFDVTPIINEVQLSWTSADELDLESYEIQRSKDGISFESIGIKNAVGPGNYTYIDRQPLYNMPIYYRLKMQNIDGSFEYSSIKTVQIDQSLRDVVLLPNPVIETATLSLSSDRNLVAYLTITNAAGEKVYVEQIILVEGDQQVGIQMKNMPAGLYTFRIQAGSEAYTFKQIKL